MNTNDKILDLVFCQIAPGRLLSNIKTALSSSTAAFYSNLTAQEDAFLNFAETVLPERSEDEQMLLLNKALKETRDFAECYGILPSVLLLLVRFAGETLTMNGQEPVCRLEHTLRWREVYLRLGQDTVVCAYLAFRDLLDRRERDNFVWPAVIHTDDSSLKSILDGGLAENHCHLNGSSQSFSVSWSRFMNDVRGTEKELDQFSRRLHAKLSRGSRDNMQSIGDDVRLAAHIRSVLFRATDRAAWRKTDRLTGETREFFGGAAFREEVLCSYLPQNEAAASIDILRHAYGMSVETPAGDHVCLDYAMHKGLSQANHKSVYRLLAGERYFMYTCSKACMNGEFSPIERELYYLYLLLKLSFRGELIQVNEQIGFKNFANYQDRKDIAWGNNPYWWEAMRMALCAPMVQDNVCSLEARVGPALSVKENLDRIRRLDLVKKFNDTGGPTTISNEIIDLVAEVEQQHFYVLHFAKRKDAGICGGNHGLVLYCRHQELRRKAKQQAEALAEALGKYSYMCTRVRGIDACSNEIGCRPETFATEFRYLRGFNPKLFKEKRSALESYALPELSATYHAGEDFLDMADGLRAIDEACQFLEFQRGDRIGHALALGVEPSLHYSRKGMEIVLPKQDHLDDLVWLLYRSQDFGIHIDAFLEKRLRAEAQALLKEIYGEAIRENNWDVELQEYYYSMQLRGDSPDLYITTEFLAPNSALLQYDSFKINHKDPLLHGFRRDKTIAGLYYYYEYGYSEKQKGNETVCVTISDDYIKLIDAMQRAMQFELETKGIIIECNPSSNVLIGSFKNYKDHPIFRFNDNGLALGQEPSAKLHTCINTDDIGVFDTSLEFEYALVYQSLRELRTATGSSTISEQDALDYVERLQKLGKLAVFPKATVIK